MRKMSPARKFWIGYSSLLGTLIAIAAVVFLSGCTSALMAMSDDPCAGVEGCVVEAPNGSAGQITFKRADGSVIETWAAMAVTGAP